jgi:hypothetical protein
VPALLICCLCGKPWRTRPERANDVSHTISGVLYSWMRLSFVCVVPVDLRGKTQGTLPQVQGPQDRDKTAGPSAVFGCCAPQRRGSGGAPGECARASRSRRAQRYRPIQGSTGLPAERGVFRANQALTSSSPFMAGIPTALPWQFRMVASAGSCFIDQPSSAASPQGFTAQFR